jgi:hypothetical protein
LDTLEPLNGLSASKTYNFKLGASMTLTPVILVPGIMGSTVGGEDTLIPYLTGGYVDPASLSLADAWPLDVIDRDVGWQDLEKVLVDNGYETGKTIIKCPYDWRKSIDIIAETTFKDCVDKGLANSSSGKVDIIAHSQGGLVTRAYMQKSVVRASTFRKIAFVGTPHLGSTEAYFAWEGGEANAPRKYVLARTLEHSGLEVKMFGSNLSQFMNIEGDTCSINIGRDSADFVAFDFTDITTDTNGASYLKVVCPGKEDRRIPLTTVGMFGSSGSANWLVDNNKFTRAFIQANAISVKELMPIYPFIKDSANATPQTIASTANQNNLLKALNGTPSGGYSYLDFASVKNLAGLQVRQFYSDDQSYYDVPFISLPVLEYDHRSVQTIVKSAINTSGLYEDGYPEIRELSDGDGTVPSNVSIEPFLAVNGITGAGDVKISSEHMTLIDTARNQIVNFIAGTSLSGTSLSAVTPRLNVGVRGGVQVRVTDPMGRVVGIDPLTGEGVNTVPNAEVNMENGNSTVSIPSPVDGTYTLTISGAAAGEYSFYSDYGSETRAEPHEFVGYHKAGAIETVTFLLNSAATADAQVLNYPFDRSPSNIIVSPITGNTKVTWSLPLTGPTPAKYRVYTKAYGDASATFVTETVALTYTTTYPFAAASTTMARQFYVSSVDTAGQESFLSLPITNDDTDGDRVSDPIEATLGSNPNLVDTDGDTLTDGQEYFMYGTNPTLADTDSDGVNDYAQVMAAILDALNASQQEDVTSDPNTHSLSLSSAATQTALTPDSPALDVTGSLTLEAWIKPSSLTPGQIYTIVGKYESGQRSYNLALEDIGSGVFQLRMTADQSCGNLLVSYKYGVHTFVPGTWYHVAGVFDAPSGNVTLYVNGVQLATGAASDSSAHSICNGTAHLRIGSQGLDQDSQFRYFDGAIDEVRVWNVARSAADITANYTEALSGAESGLKGYWELNNNYTPTATAGGILTVVNSPVFTTQVPFDGGNMRPVITITGNNPETVVQYTAYTDIGATAVDAEDGVRPVTATSTVNVMQQGTYFVNYSATDTQGKLATSTRVVYVVGSVLGGNTHSLSLNGSTGLVWPVAGAPYASHSGALSIEAWMKLDVLPTGVQTIVSRYDRQYGRSFALWFQPYAGQTLIGFRVDESGYNSILSNKDIQYPFVAGTWYHVAGTFNPLTQEIKIYVNGVELTSAAVSQESLANTIYTNTTVDALIGAEYNGAPTMQSQFKGLLDEVRVWSTTRAPEEIAMNVSRELTGSEPGLIGYWPFENSTSGFVSGGQSSVLAGAATFVAEAPFVGLNTPPIILLSGANPITIIQGAPYIEPGFMAVDPEDGLVTNRVVTSSNLDNAVPSTYTISYAATDLTGLAATTTRTVIVVPLPTVSNTHSLSLSGALSQQASVSDAVQTGLDPTGSFTLESWIRPSALPTTGNVAVIMGKYDSSPANQRGYQLALENVAGSVQLKMTVDESCANGTNVSYRYGTFTFALNSWYHVAGVYDAATKAVKVYVNGNELPLGAGQQSLASRACNTTVPFRIGAMGGVSRFFSGLIDEVRVWSVARTQAEIQQDYARSPESIPSTLRAYWRLNNNYTDSAGSNTLVPTNNPNFAANVAFALNGVLSWPVFQLAGVGESATSSATSTLPLLIDEVASTTDPVAPIPIDAPAAFANESSNSEVLQNDEITSVPTEEDAQVPEVQETQTPAPETPPASPPEDPANPPPVTEPEAGVSIEAL